MNGVTEIFFTKQWMILPAYVHGILPTVMYNTQNRTALGIDREKKAPMAVNAGGDDIMRGYEVTEDGTVLPTHDGWAGIDYLKDLKEPFVNIIPVDGPITRNGGACSYGSREIRDWMMKAANNPYCRAHIFLTNTPGGSAWARNDFRMAIDYAHAKGQKVYDSIDGLSASMGTWLSALCDEVYVTSLEDQLGCVGVMASFFTMKNGDKNQFTNETYREYYATKSINKNKEMRDIANDDNATLLIKELDETEAEFRAEMKKAFPHATDDHLDGKVFKAKDVMGILCDGQMMLGDLVSRAFAVADGTEQPIARTADRVIGPQAKTSKAAQQARRQAAAQQRDNNPLKNSINMKEKFPKVFALLGVEAMECGEDGTFFNASLLQTLEAKVAEMQQKNAEAKALVEQLTAEKQLLTEQMEQLKADHEKAIGTLKADHEKALGEVDETHQQAIAKKDQEIADMNAKVQNLEQDITAKEETIGNLQNDLKTANDSLEAANKAIEEKDAAIAAGTQKIDDLEAQVAELTTSPGNTPQAGNAPQGNGGGADAPQVVAGSVYAYDPDKSYAENMRLKKEWEEQHK